MLRVFADQPGVAHREWIEKYGNGVGAVRFRGVFGEDRVLITDPAALTHILVTNSYDYPKPLAVRGELSRILGKGLVFVEGDDHRRQRKIMNPAFSPSALRDLTPLFFELSYKLRDHWLDLLSTDTVDESAFKSQAAVQAFKESRPDDSQIVVNVMRWMSRYTLDVIGKGGFGYTFDALDGKENVLREAFSNIFSSSVSLPTTKTLLIQNIMAKVAVYLPAIVIYAPSKRVKAFRKAFDTMNSEGRKIVQARKSELEGSATEDESGKDLLTLMLKANASGDVKMRMSDEELQGQMTTFLLAGHETTASSLTWGLWQLAKNHAIQDKLRKEIRQARSKAKEEGRDELGSDELNSLEYLDAVCREILRVECPVSATVRCSEKDDLIPLSAPITGISGRKISYIPVKAGGLIILSFNAANFNKSVFGEDAEDFRPERWIEGHVGEKQGGVGVYSQLLTFLAGPRACIGYKFSLLEMKAALSVLVDTLEFDEREPGLAIRHQLAFVASPIVIGEEQELAYAMPLRVKLAK